MRHLGVVLAAGGYPENYGKGEIIQGLSNESATQKVFHAGTALNGKEVVTNGGRVLCATALGANIAEAQKNAYEITKKIILASICFIVMILVTKQSIKFLNDCSIIYCE